MRISGAIGPTDLVIFLAILLFAVALGLTIIASGQVFLAIRETALNTRNEKSNETAQYRILLTVAKLNNFIGWVIIILGILVAWFITRLI
jgi:ABC-type nickel/cobalt efflux system permease component RcnA